MWRERADDAQSRRGKVIPLLAQEATSILDHSFRSNQKWRIRLAAKMQKSLARIGRGLPYC
jgi:hypothetical protein